MGRWLKVYCPYCGSMMTGKPGKRVCIKYPNCAAHEVDTSNPKDYDRKRTNKEIGERKNE